MRGRPTTAVAVSGSTIPAMANPAGQFIDGTIGRWLEESVAVFAQFCRGPTVVIGSSMGGWMALLLAREVARRSDGTRRWRAWC